MRAMEKINILWVLIVINIGVTAALVLHTTSLQYLSGDTLKRLHYETEAATLVSPHGLREKMEHGENPYLLVDVREKEHYVLGHITEAVNIPPDGDMVEAFRELQKKHPEKELLIYCYTEVCMRGRKVGRELAKNGIFVRELGIGFQEWKYDWKKWNYEWEWEHVDMQPLITTGEKPGVLILEKGKEKEGCSANAGFSC